jgi:phosphoserine phosphatase
MKIFVFDFDKTLTYKDTLLPFFLFIANKDLCFIPKMVIYILMMCLVKLKFITTYKLKTIGIRFFLKNISENKIDEKAALYAKKIKLNKVYEDYKLALKSDNKVFIISASFDTYLKYLFYEDNVTLIASSILFDKKLAIGLKYECYGYEKIKKLFQNNIYKVNVLYTDSYSDAPIAEISNEICIVKGDNKKYCESYADFKKYFNK